MSTWTRAENFGFFLDILVGSRVDVVTYTSKHVRSGSGRTAPVGYCNGRYMRGILGYVNNDGARKRNLALRH